MNWNSEFEARERIKDLVGDYYRHFKKDESLYKPGNRISYAGRVFDEEELRYLTDAM